MTAMLGGLCWFVFVVSAFFLMLIILIQEGKGGGLAEAFGGQGAETFGVKATGVNRVTTILAIAFVLSSIFINKLSDRGGGIMSKASAEVTSTEGGIPGAGPAPDDPADEN